MDKKSRRTFLKETAGAALGLSCGSSLLTTACSSARGGFPRWGTGREPVGHGHRPGKGPESRGAGSLYRSLHPGPQHSSDRRPGRERSAGSGKKSISTSSRTRSTTRCLHPIMEAPVLVLCNHCTNPPCVRVCPTQATWKREEDGIVMMDMHRCIGCRYCMAACPYGSRSFNWKDPREFVDTDAQGNFYSEFPTRTRGVVEKCNFCAERLRDGLQPACVEAANQVPGGEGALTFGNLADSGSEVNRVLSSQRTITRRVSLGTGPNVFYIV